jgi:predicted enzyme related to lactoylglutathione lyase
MALRLESLTIDAAEPAKLARFWADVFGVEPAQPDDDGDVEFELAPGLPVLFVTDATPKTTKNRLHVDLRPDDRDAEVERILGLGATNAEIGQTGDETWVVLADPEGNEFCVLASASS